MGFAPMTPPDTPTPIVSFVVKEPEAVKAKLKKANVEAKVVGHYMRVSPSVYNDEQDIDRLLKALA